MPKDKDHKRDHGGRDASIGAGRDQAEERKLERKDYVDKRHPAQVLARGESRRAGKAPQDAHRRCAQDLEAHEDGLEVVFALG
jgi:hypothetical protein